jgi:hypothetical protein
MLDAREAMARLTAVATQMAEDPLDTALRLTPIGVDVVDSKEES